MNLWKKYLINLIQSGLPNTKLKPIFLDKFFKFARTQAKCAVPAECDPMHVVVFLTQWTAKRNYSLAGVRTLVQWLTEVHSLVEGRPLAQHPRLEEFVTSMEQRLEMKQEPGLGADVKPPLLIDTKKENEYYGDTIVNPFELIKATVCNVCNEKFPHTTKLLYHMLHLHKVNPVHYINKHLRAKPVRCPHCEKPCMSPITYAVHADQHLLNKAHQCPSCNVKYSSFLKYYTEDICGDNAIPKNVKMFVNNIVSKLKFLEEDTEIIGENFANHFSKYAKRATIQELPRDYRKLKKGPRFRKSKTAYRKDLDVHQMYMELYDYCPESIEEWVLNMPTMLDARISLSLVDKNKADNQLEEEFEWVFEDGDTEKIVFEEVSPRKAAPKNNFCTMCKKCFATVADLDQHNVVHKVKTEPEPETETEQGKSSSAMMMSMMTPRHRKPSSAKPISTASSSVVTTIICADCDGCSADCDHSDHGIMLRRDSIAEHVARTGHARCRVAAEIRPQTDCKVRHY